jgi:iron complex transport system substrate-binding protein
MSTRHIAAALVALALLTACGSDEPAAAPTTTATAASTSTAAPTTATAATSAALTTTAAAAAFPVTVTAGNGPVTIAAAPRRVVSLSPSLTEMLYAVGAGDQVAAVDKYSNYPAGTPVTDLSGFKPNVEAVAALTPDLVVVAGDRDGLVAALGTVGVPTLLLPPAKSLDDTYGQLTTIGAATGHADQAAATVATMRQQVDALTARVPEREAPLTDFYELADDGHTVTSSTFIGNVLSLAGLTSIADAAPDQAGGYPQLSSEAILAADPAVVFLAHSDGANPTTEELAARPGWSELQAVRDGHVVALDPDVASRWGPRVVDLLAAVVDATAGIT